MTQPNKENAKQAPAETKPAMNERFKKIETERYMYSPNGGCLDPLVGYLINLIAMPPIKDRDWNAFVIRTTEETKVLDRDKKLITAPKGSEVLIPATYQLVQILEKASLQPDRVYEVFIKPSKKIPVGGGQTMWTFELGADMAKPLPRGKFGPSAMLGGSEQIKQLPARTADNAETAGGDDDIPF